MFNIKYQTNAVEWLGLYAIVKFLSIWFVDITVTALVVSLIVFVSYNVLFELKIKPWCLKNFNSKEYDRGGGFYIIAGALITLVSLFVLINLFPTALIAANDVFNLYTIAVILCCLYATDIGNKFFPKEFK